VEKIEKAPFSNNSKIEARKSSLQDWITKKK
jgi:hypothetical protein